MGLVCDGLADELAAEESGLSTWIKWPSLSLGFSCAISLFASE